MAKFDERDDPGTPRGSVIRTGSGGKLLSRDGSVVRTRPEPVLFEILGPDGVKRKRIAERVLLEATRDPRRKR